jgi:hypothetical protein
LHAVICFLIFATPNVRAAADKPLPKLTAQDLPKIWADLGEHDDEACKLKFQHQERMIQVPDLVIPFLRERLKAAKGLDRSGIPEAIADLDSNDFSTREKAMKRLESLGGLALPLLEQKLKEKDLSLEMQNRLKRLVQGAQSTEGKGLSADDLRAVRAVFVLQAIGSADARAILQTLARGDETSPLTHIAAIELKNLDRRTGSKEK